MTGSQKKGQPIQSKTIHTIDEKLSLTYSLKSSKTTQPLSLNSSFIVRIIFRRLSLILIFFFSSTPFSKKI